MIIPLDTLQHLPTGVHDILQLVALPTAAIYVREPLPSGSIEMGGRFSHLRCRRRATHI